jgi:S1-C subfamily serine protease
MQATLTKPKWNVLLAACLTLALVPAGQAHADTETIYNKLLHATGWINCPQPNGGNSWGTCWVYDREQRLVITNKHVIDEATTVLVDFPLYRDGKLLTNLADYLQTRPIQGKVLAFDEKRDLALCQLDSLPAGIESLPLAKTSARPGNKIFSVGNSNANTPKQQEAKLWRQATGKVEMRYFDVITFQKPPIQKVEATSIRGSLKTAGGDSGGPVVNTSGELVAVHSNGDTFNSFSIDVCEVRIFVERAMQKRRPPSPSRQVAGTWTVATTDELGKCYWSLTVHADGRCVLERDDSHDGAFLAVRDGKARLSVPSLQMRGEVLLRWTSDDQFSFTLHGMDYTATRR